MADARQIINEIQQLEEFYVPMTLNSRVPYQEYANSDQAHIIHMFRTEEEAKKFIEDKKPEGIPMGLIKVDKKQEVKDMSGMDMVMQFYKNMHLMDVNHIIYHAEVGALFIPLPAIIQINMNAMQGNGLPVENKKLVGLTARCLQESNHLKTKSNDEAWVKKFREIETDFVMAFTKSKFIFSFNRVDKEEDGKKVLDIENTVRQPIFLQKEVKKADGTQDVQMFQPIFTDMNEAQTFFGNNPNVILFPIPYDKIVTGLHPSLGGYLMNPSNLNFIVTAQQLKVWTEISEAKKREDAQSGLLLGDDNTY